MAKNILLLSRDFFAYDEQIISSLKKNGFKVYNFSTKPVYGTFDKILLHIANKYAIRTLNEKKQDQIFKEIEKLDVVFDVILVVSGVDLQAKLLDNLQEKYKNAKFVWYLWDNIKNLKNFNSIKNKFHKIVSFDLVDAQNYQLPCIPLFYSTQIDIQEKKYDFCFIGSDHSRRAEIIQELSNKIDLADSFVYILSSKSIRYKRFFKFNKIKKFFYYKPLQYDKVIELMAQSRCVIDIPDSRQTGLTMRTFETLGVGSKLLTTNTTVNKYDFYDENNVFIYNQNSTAEEIQKFMNKHKKTKNVDLYSIESWTRRLIDIMISNS